MTTAAVIACAAFCVAGFTGGFIAAAMRAAHEERPLPGPQDREWPQRHVTEWPWQSSDFPASDRAENARAADAAQRSSSACAEDAGKLSIP